MEKERDFLGQEKVGGRQLVVKQCSMCWEAHFPMNAMLAHTECMETHLKS